MHILFTLSRHPHLPPLCLRASRVIAVGPSIPSALRLSMHFPPFASCFVSPRVGPTRPLLHPPTPVPASPPDLPDLPLLLASVRVHLCLVSRRTCASKMSALRRASESSPRIPSASSPPLRTPLRVPPLPFSPPPHPLPRILRCTPALRLAPYAFPAPLLVRSFRVPHFFTFLSVSPTCFRRK
ncbi:hypothetical protein B0H17DRAFT_1213460 [Mycena rosella]|uniref:Uncharacterized protein n=1 Tax=Mycena rosella TaxID=1033263 RepID=A0AAD7CQ41_MYCRO|nr:hypothetical protein B0H17DRAFT_1213460 [Mycena rosella]